MRSLALVAILGTVVATPAVAANFVVNIGSPVGTPSCGSANGAGSAPVSREVVCSVFGGAPLAANAAATFGHVGGSTSAAVGFGYVGSSFGINTQSTFQDFVTFTSDDDSVTHVLVAANLAFSGTMNSTAFATAGVDFMYAMNGAIGGRFFAATDDFGIARNDFSVVQGSVSGGISNALLRTESFLTPVDTPLLMTLQLGTGAGVGGSGSPESASAHFSNSFEIPIGIDAFVLPSGVTANAGDWLVNNRRVGPNAVVPEPATWAMMILGFGAVGSLMRRRRFATRAFAC